MVAAFVLESVTPWYIQQGSDADSGDRKSRKLLLIGKLVYGCARLPRTLLGPLDSLDKA